MKHGMKHGDIDCLGEENGMHHPIAELHIQHVCEVSELRLSDFFARFGSLQYGCNRDQVLAINIPVASC